MTFSKQVIFSILLSASFFGSIDAMEACVDKGAEIGVKGGAIIGTCAGFIVGIPVECGKYCCSMISKGVNKACGKGIPVKSLSKMAKISESCKGHPAACFLGGVIVSGAVVYYFMRRHNNGVVPVQQQANVNNDFMNQVRAMAGAPCTQTCQNQQQVLTDAEFLELAQRPVENAAAATAVSASQVNNAQLGQMTYEQLMSQHLQNQQRITESLDRYNEHVKLCNSSGAAAVAATNASCSASQE